MNKSVIVFLLFFELPFSTTNLNLLNFVEYSPQKAASATQFFHISCSDHLCVFRKYPSLQPFRKSLFLSSLSCFFFIWIFLFSWLLLHFFWVKKSSFCSLNLFASVPKTTPPWICDSFYLFSLLFLFNLFSLFCVLSLCSLSLSLLFLFSFFSIFSLCMFPYACSPCVYLLSLLCLLFVCILFFVLHFLNRLYLSFLLWKNFFICSSLFCKTVLVLSPYLFPQFFLFNFSIVFVQKR